MFQPGRSFAWPPQRHHSPRACAGRAGCGTWPPLAPSESSPRCCRLPPLPPARASEPSPWGGLCLWPEPFKVQRASRGICFCCDNKEKAFSPRTPWSACRSGALPPRPRTRCRWRGVSLVSSGGSTPAPRRLVHQPGFLIDWGKLKKTKNTVIST